MSEGLDVVILDDDPGISQVLKELIETFYTWGKVFDSRMRKRLWPGASNARWG